MNFSDIELIVSEIDGIITDGAVALDHLNYTPFKFYCNRDFEVINELKRNFTFVFLSTDPSVSYNVMRNKNIPSYFSSKKEPKLEILTKKIMSRYNMRPENLLYIGNTISDIPCMNLAEISFTLRSSVNKVMTASTGLLASEAGDGVICEVYDILVEEQEKRKRTA